MGNKLYGILEILVGLGELVVTFVFMDTIGYAGILFGFCGSTTIISGVSRFN